MIKKKYLANTPEMEKLAQQAKSGKFTEKISLCIKFDRSSRILPNYVYISRDN